jgi:hypothetical protein
MYQQRSTPEPGTLQGRGPWRPRVEPEGSELVPGPADSYVVVDDLEADRVILVLDPWPQVGASGHLVFSGPAVVRDFPVATLQSLVDDQRARAGQPAANRPLRVGDVFWVRADADGRRQAPQTWSILDITGPARRAAHAAQLVAANPALRTATDQHAGEPEEPTSAAQPQRPSASAAPPAV